MHICICGGDYNNCFIKYSTRVGFFSIYFPFTIKIGFPSWHTAVDYLRKEIDLYQKPLLKFNHHWAKPGLTSLEY